MYLCDPGHRRDLIDTAKTDEDRLPTDDAEAGNSDHDDILGYHCGPWRSEALFSLSFRFVASLSSLRSKTNFSILSIAYARSQMLQVCLSIIVFNVYSIRSILFKLYPVRAVVLRWSCAQLAPQVVCCLLLWLFTSHDLRSSHCLAPASAFRGSTEQLKIRVRNKKDATCSDKYLPTVCT